MPTQSTDSMRFTHALEGMENAYSHLDETILNERVRHLLLLYNFCMPCDKHFKLYLSLSCQRKF